MPKLLPVLEGEEIIGILFKLGFLPKRKRGSHVILTNGKRTVTVPVHQGKDIPRGTLGSIIKQAGIHKEDFLRHCQK